MRKKCRRWDGRTARASCRLEKMFRRQGRLSRRWQVSNLEQEDNDDDDDNGDATLRQFTKTESELLRAAFFSVNSQNFTKINTSTAAVLGQNRAQDPPSSVAESKLCPPPRPSSPRQSQISFSHVLCFSGEARRQSATILSVAVLCIQQPSLIGTAGAPQTQHRTNNIQTP